jgi:hypothetical protein
VSASARVVYCTGRNTFKRTKLGHSEAQPPGDDDHPSVRQARCNGGQYTPKRTLTGIQHDGIVAFQYNKIIISVNLPYISTGQQLSVNMGNGKVPRRRTPTHM